MPSEKSGGLLEGEVTTTWGHSEPWDRRHPRLRQLDPPLTAAFRAVLQYRSADSESLSILERLGVVVPANGGKWQVCTHHPSPALLNDMLPHLSSLAAIDADAMARVPQWHQLRAMATYCAIAATAHSHSMRDQLPEAFIHRYVGELAAGAFLSFKQLVGVSNSTGGKLANLAADGYVADAVIVDAAVCRMDCVEATAPSIETVLQRCRLFSKRGDGMATQLPHVAKFLKAVGLTTSDDLRAPFVFAWTCVPEANKTWPPTLSVPLPHGMASLDPAAWTPPVDGSSSTTAGSNDVGGGSAVNRDSSTEAAVVERPTRFCGIAVDSSLDINASDRSAFVEKGETWTVTSDSAAMPAEPRAAPRIPDGTGPLKVATDVNTKKDRDATRLHRLENDHAVRYRNAAHSTKPGGCGPDKPRDSEHSPGAPKICTTTAPPTATTVAAGCGPGEDLTVSLQFPFNRATPVAFNFRGMEVTRGPRSTPLSESETSQAWASAACDGRHPQLRILTEAQKAAIRCLYAGGALTPSGAKRKPVLLGLVELGVVACETATPEMSDFTVSPNVTAHMLPHVMPSAKTVDAVASPQYQRIRALALYASIVVAAARSLTTEQRSDKPRTHMIKYVEQYVADEEMAKRFVNEALDGPCAVAREEGSLKWMEVTFRGAPLKTPAARLVPDGFVADGIVMDAACELAAHSRPSVNSHVIDSQLTSSLLLTELPQGARDHVIRFLHAVGLLASESPSAPFASQWESLPLAEQKWPPHWPLPFPHTAVADPAAWASRAAPVAPSPPTVGVVEASSAAPSSSQVTVVDARSQMLTHRVFEYVKLCGAHVAAPTSAGILKQLGHVAKLITKDVKANVVPQQPDSAVDIVVLDSVMRGVADGASPATVHADLHHLKSAPPVAIALMCAKISQSTKAAAQSRQQVTPISETLEGPNTQNSEQRCPPARGLDDDTNNEDALGSTPDSPKKDPGGKVHSAPPSAVDQVLTALATARARYDVRQSAGTTRGVVAAFAAIKPEHVEAMTADQAQDAINEIADDDNYIIAKFTPPSAMVTVHLLHEKLSMVMPQEEIDSLFQTHVAGYHRQFGDSSMAKLLDDFWIWWRDNKVDYPELSDTALGKVWTALIANPPPGLKVAQRNGEPMVVRADGESSADPYHNSAARPLQSSAPSLSPIDQLLVALERARTRHERAQTARSTRDVCAAFAAITPEHVGSMTEQQARLAINEIVDDDGFTIPQLVPDSAATTLRLLQEKTGMRAAQTEIDELFRSRVEAVYAQFGDSSKAQLLEDFYWWWRDNKPNFPDVSETALKKAWKALTSNPPVGLKVINEKGELMVVRAEDSSRVTVPPPPKATSQVSTASPSRAAPPPKATAAPAEQPTSPTVEYDSTTPPEQLLLVTVATMSGGVGNVIGKKSDAIKRAQRRFPFLTETALKKAWKVLVDDGCVKVTDGTAALHRAELLEPPVPLAAAAAHWILTKEEEARKALLEAEADSREGIECYRTYKLLGSGLSTAPYADVKHLVQRIAAVRHVFAQLSFPGEAYVSTMVLTLEARLKTVPSQAHVNSLFSEFVRDVNAPSSLRSKSEDTRKQWYFEAFTQRRWVLLHPLHRLEQIRLDAAWQHVTAQTKSPEPAVAPVTPKPKQAEPTDAIAAAIQDLSYHSLREMYLEEEDVINIVLVVVGCWSELVTASQPCTKGHAISRITTQGPVHPLMKKQPQRCRDALERCFGMNLCYDKPNAGTTLLRLTAAGAARLYRVKAAWVAKTEPTPSPPPPAPTSARLSPMPVSPAPASPLVPPTPVPVQVPVRVAPTPSVLPQAPAVVVPQPTVEMSYHSLREMYLEEQDVVIVALIVVGCWSELVTASQPCTKGNAISRATMQGPVHPLLKKDSQRCRDALERCVALKYCDETKNADGHSVLSLSGTGVSRLAAVKTKWVGKMAPSPSPPPVSTAPPQAPVTPVPAQTPSPPVAVARVAPLPQVSVRVGTDSAPANLSHAALANMYMEEGDEVIIALIVVGCWSELVTASQPCTKGNAISRATMQGPVHPLLMKDSQRCRGALERCVALKYCVEQKNADGHGVLSLSPAGASRLSAVKAKWAAKIKETWPGSSSPGPPALTPSPAPVAAVASAPPAATPQGSATKPAAPPPKRVLKKTPVGQLPTSPCPGAMLTPPPAAPAAVVPPQRTVPGRSVLHPGAPQALDNTLLSAFMGPSTVAPQPRDNPPSMTMQSARAAPEHSFDPFDLYSTPSPSSAAHTAAAPALAKKKQQAPPTPPLAQAPYEQTTPAPAIASTAADAFFEQPAASAPRRTIAQDKVEAAMNAFFQ